MKRSGTKRKKKEDIQERIFEKFAKMDRKKWNETKKGRRYLEKNI